MMYDNKFNQEQENCIPIALSVYLGEFLTRNDLCKLYHCSKIYITIRKEGKDHKIDNKNKKLQVINIPPTPDEFENQDGDTIYINLIFEILICYTVKDKILIR